MLPPPADDFCNSATVSASKIVIKASSNVRMIHTLVLRVFFLISSLFRIMMDSYIGNFCSLVENKCISTLGMLRALQLLMPFYVLLY